MKLLPKWPSMVVRGNEDSTVDYHRCYNAVRLTFKLNVIGIFPRQLDGCFSRYYMTVLLRGTSSPLLLPALACSYIRLLAFAQHRLGRDFFHSSPLHFCQLHSAGDTDEWDRRYLPRVLDRSRMPLPEQVRKQPIQLQVSHQQLAPEHVRSVSDMQVSCILPPAPSLIQRVS